jgi:ribonuclease G
LADWRSDDAPGERRVALVEGTAIVEIHIWRPPAVLVGQVCDGKIISQEPLGTLCETHDGQQVLLRQRAVEPLGHSVRIGITRAAYAEPGQDKLALGAVVESETPLCDCREVWSQRFGVSGAQINLGPLIDVALAGQVRLADKAKDIGSVSWERTKAGLVFDVDGRGDTHAVNLAAAQQIVRFVRLYQVGGSVLIDFISSRNKDERLAIGTAYDAASMADTRAFERSAVNGFGLMQIVRQRTGPSLLDLISGSQRDGVSAESQALLLLRDAARSIGVGPRTLVVPSLVATLLSTPRFASLLADVAKQAGAPVLVVEDASITQYGHVHVAQR